MRLQWIFFFPRRKAGSLLSQQAPPPGPATEILAWDALCNVVMSDKGDWKLFRRLAGGAGKGYAVGAVLKGGLSAFAMLARVRARSSWWNFKFVFLVEFRFFFLEDNIFCRGLSQF